MGLIQSQEIQNQLLSFGRSPDTPVALVNRGTTSDQQVVIGKLSELTLLGGGLQGATLMIIGEVVSLAEKLAWFEPEGNHKLSRDPFLVNLS